jgi:hypothetical protein
MKVLQYSPNSEIFWTQDAEWLMSWKAPMLTYHVSCIMYPYSSLTPTGRAKSQVLSMLYSTTVTLLLVVAVVNN